MLAALTLAGLLLSARPQGDVEGARAAFAQGQDLYRAGDWQGALDAFEAAQARVPSPAAVYNIARCEERLGQLTDALETYEKYLALASDAPDRAAVIARVQTLRERLDPETQIRISVEPGGAALSVDGRPAGTAPLTTQVSPGIHVVEAQRDGFETLTREVEVRPGATVQLELSLRPSPSPTAAGTRVPSAALRDLADLPPPPAPRPGRRWTWVAAGVAVVALGAGIAFALSARRASGDLRLGVRPQDQVQQLYDTAVARSTASNAFYVGSGIAAATSVGLFFFEPRLGGSPTGAR